MGKTSIEWTDCTWNPVRGCTRVSEGCRNCYAERQAARFARVPSAEEDEERAIAGMPDARGPFAGFAENTKAGPRWTGRVELIPGKLAEPLSWKTPRRCFVNSMSDLFHEALAFEQIVAVFGVMAAAPLVTFQVLTKRPERAREFLSWLEAQGGLGVYIRGNPRALSPFFDASIKTEVIRGRKARSAADPWCMVFNAAACNMGPGPLRNVWLGCSVENQATADERIPHLLACPATIRFISYEPALGPINFNARSRKPGAALDEITDEDDASGPPLGGIDGIDWLIVGGESGPGARPFDLAWARAAISQCKEAGVACFVKQLGAFPYEVGGWHSMPSEMGGHNPKCSNCRRLRDRKGGNMQEWPNDLRMRQFPEPHP